MALEQLLQVRLERARVGDDLGARHRGEVGAIGPERDRHLAFLVDLGPLGGRHHPAEVLADLRYEIFPLVGRVRRVRRHVGVVTEERQVELFHRHRRLRTPCIRTLERLM